ncbi:hypothetical protein [Kitasatospora purpeofusca]|uniref:hypothetical protein n=1 Tax=Kitasatospora purpeofusca TaxID=67352 RepID=UPI003687070F
MSTPVTTDRPTLDVAFGEHPDLGIAAVTEGLPTSLMPALAQVGWRHLPDLDIDRAPTHHRGDGLDAVAVATLPDAVLARGLTPDLMSPDDQARIARRAAQLGSRPTPVTADTNRTH